MRQATDRNSQKSENPHLICSYSHKVICTSMSILAEMHSIRREKGIERTDDETYKAIQMVRQITRDMDYTLNRFLATAYSNSKRRKK